MLRVVGWDQIMCLCSFEQFFPSTSMVLRAVAKVEYLMVALILLIDLVFGRVVGCSVCTILQVCMNVIINLV
jgi:hypothetical protein